MVFSIWLEAEKGLHQRAVARKTRNCAPEWLDHLKPLYFRENSNYQVANKTQRRVAIGTGTQPKNDLKIRSALQKLAEKGRT